MDFKKIKEFLEQKDIDLVKLSTLIAGLKRNIDYYDYSKKYLLQALEIMKKESVDELKIDDKVINIENEIQKLT